MIKKRIGKGIYLQKSEIDGFWLQFKTSNGLHASINLSEAFRGGGIINLAIMTWAEEQIPGGKYAS